MRPHPYGTSYLLLLAPVGGNNACRPHAWLVLLFINLYRGSHRSADDLKIGVCTQHCRLDVENARSCVDEDACLTSHHGLEHVVRPCRTQMGHCWSSHGDKRDERASNWHHRQPHCSHVYLQPVAQLVGFLACRGLWIAIYTHCMQCMQVRTRSFFLYASI